MARTAYTVYDDRHALSRHANQATAIGQAVLATLRTGTPRWVYEEGGLSCRWSYATLKLGYELKIVTR
jgi:hypothetical protein